MKQVEELIKKILDDMLLQEEAIEMSPDLTATFPVAILDKIEERQTGSNGTFGSFYHFEDD